MESAQKDLRLDEEKAAGVLTAPPPTPEATAGWLPGEALPAEP